MPRLPTRTPLLCVTALLASCGVGGGGHQGPAKVTITRDFGATVVREGEIEGGGTVGDLPGSRYVNGVAAGADTKVHGGDRVWSDRHAGAARSAAVVGSFPEPFVHGIDGKRLPVRIECADARAAPCQQVAERLVSYEVPAALGGLQTARAAETLRVLVGPWSALRGDAAVAALERGPRASGVYATIAPDGRTVAVLDARGRRTRTLGPGTGLVAATQPPDERPTWVVTGTDAAGVASAARAFEEGTLDHRFALAVSRDLPVPLPAAASSIG